MLGPTSTHIQHTSTHPTHLDEAVVSDAERLERGEQEDAGRDLGELVVVQVDEREAAQARERHVQRLEAVVVEQQRLRVLHAQDVLGHLRVLQRGECVCVCLCACVRVCVCV